MSKRRFALIEGGKKRLEVVQPMFSNKRIIKLDDRIVGEIPNQKALKAGWALKGKDGQQLTIRSTGGFLSSNGLDIRFNNKSVPGSDANPKTRLSQAYGAVYFVGVVNVALGLLSILSPSTTIGVGLSQSGGYPAIIAGIAYLIVGFFIQRRSKIALGFAILALVIDGVLLVMSIPTLIGSNAYYSSGLMGGMVGGLFVRFFFVLYLFKAFSAIDELNAESAL